MHITFADQRTRDLCEKSQTASRRLGQHAAKALRSFVADVESVSSLAELPYTCTYDAEGAGSIRLGCDLELQFTYEDRGYVAGMSEMRIDGVIKHE